MDKHHVPTGVAAYLAFGLGLLLAGAAVVLGLFAVTDPAQAQPVARAAAQPMAQALSGDLNRDGVVNGLDLAIFAQHFGVAGCGTSADLNGDCVVNGVDLAIFAQNFGRTALTPSGTSTPTVTPTGGIPLPDLAITSVSYGLQTGDACFVQGTPSGVRVRIINQDAGSAGAFDVEVNGVRQRLTALAAGQSASLFFPQSLMVGATTVVILDPSNEVIESNEGNNSLSTLLAIPTLPIPCTPTPTRTPFAT